LARAGRGLPTFIIGHAIDRGSMSACRTAHEEVIGPQRPHGNSRGTV
jgi:hypothetical protein